jgi:hypothetical protein
MSNGDVMRSFAAAMQAKDWDTVATYLADDFTCTGIRPQPLDAQAFLAGQRALAAALPDWQFALQNLEERGDVVTAIASTTGTFIHPLAMPGMPPIPPDGQPLAQGDDRITATLRGARIATLDIRAPRSMLDRLGVSPSGGR